MEDMPPKDEPEIIEETVGSIELETETEIETEKAESKEWIELMGKDIQLKITASNNSDADAAEEGVSCDIGCAVLIDFVGRVVEEESEKENEAGPIFQEVKDWFVVIGDKDTTPALEMGVRFMKEGDEGLIYSHSKFGYGPLTRAHGDYELPPNSNLQYRVTLRQVVMDYSSPELQLRIAQNKKQIGNDRYIHEWSNGNGMSKPLHNYKKAADNMTQLLAQDEMDPDQTKQAETLLLDCLNNVAAVYLKAKEYNKAKAAATEVLAKDPNNFKALLRAARAAMMDPASAYEETEAAIQAAEDVDDGSSKDLRQLRAEFIRRKREYEKKSKAMYAKMMGSNSNSGSSKQKKNNEEEATKVSREASVVKKVDQEGDEVIEEVMTPGVQADAVEQQATREIAPETSKESEKPHTVKDFLIKYRAYIFQLILPFITYSVFLMMKNTTSPDEGSLEDDAPQIRDMNTEF